MLFTIFFYSFSDTKQHNIIPFSSHIDLYFSNYSCRISGHYGIRFNIMCNDTACPDYTVLTNRYPWKNGSSGPNPRSSANMYGFTCNHHTVLKVVIIRYELYVGCNLNIIVDCNASSRHHQTAIHDNNVIPNLHVMRANYGKRSIHSAVCSHAREKPVKQIVVFFCHWHGMVKPEHKLCMFFG